MEARQAFEGASISKSFVAVVLVLIALGLGVMGGYAAKSLTGSAATTAPQAQTHFAPATNLRQDNDYPQRPVNPQRSLRIVHS